jgi:hypothetical protein
VHDRSVRDEAFLTELYDKLGSFHDDLLRAPRTLQDARVLLYWTAAMLNAPLCQGDVKQRATAAFEEAKALYDKARQKLVEGQSVNAVRRLHAAMRRISTLRRRRSAGAAVRVRSTSASRPRTCR